MTAFKYGDKVRVTIDATIYGKADAGGRTIYDLLFDDQVITIDPDVDSVGMTSEKADQAEFLSITQLATRLGVSKMTARRMVELGELPAIRVLRSIRVPVSAYELWLAEALKAGAK